MSLTAWRVTDDVDDHLAAQYNRAIDSTIRAEIVTSAAMSGTVSLADDDTPLQRLNCNGANRIVKLPAYSGNNHPFLIINVTAATYTLDVQSSSGVSLLSAMLSPAGGAALLLPDGAAGYKVMAVYPAVGSDGWIPVLDTWAYASATTITVPTDATLTYRIGDRIRWKQGGAYKYGTVSSVAATVLALDANADYSVANAAITDVAYSHIDWPIGFPTGFNWTITPSGFTVGNGTVVAQFQRFGSYIDFGFSFTIGNSGGSGITGTFSFNLPAAPSPATVCLALLNDTGTTIYQGICGSSGGSLYVRVANASGTYVTTVTELSSTVPHTWAATDIVSVAGRYKT